MTKYSVELTDAAIDAIIVQARYIAVEALAPLNAQRCLEAVWDAVDSLEQWPRRAVLAEEDAYVSYEVRQLVVGGHLLLFTVDDDRRVPSRRRSTDAAACARELQAPRSGGIHDGWRRDRPRSAGARRQRMWAGLTLATNHR